MRFGQSSYAQVLATWVVLVAIAFTGCAAGPGHKSLPAPVDTSTSVPPASSRPPIDHGDRSKRRVAITFDSNMTDAMLRELDEHKVTSFDNSRVVDELIDMKVPATFFLAGKWIERYPDETRRLASNDLFELGSHSYAHRAFTAKCYGLGSLPTAEMKDDVMRSESLLKRYTNQPTAYFRFPGLCWSPTALEIVQSAGVAVIGGDVASGDAFGTNANAIIDNTLKKANNGSIIVMHITGGNTAPKTAEAVPAIVKGLRERGFELVKVSTLLDG